MKEKERTACEEAQAEEKHSINGNKKKGKNNDDDKKKKKKKDKLDVAAATVFDYRAVTVPGQPFVSRSQGSACQLAPSGVVKAGPQGKCETLSLTELYCLYYLYVWSLATVSCSVLLGTVMYWAVTVLLWALPLHYLALVLLSVAFSPGSRSYVLPPECLFSGRPF